MCAKQKSWYLRKSDGSEYGPVSTSELLRWAEHSRIVAGNGVSADREIWQKVEDIAELKMDWVAHRPDGKEYGPFNLAATRELFEHNVLPADAVLNNRSTGQAMTVDAVLNGEYSGTGSEYAEEAEEKPQPSEPAGDPEPLETEPEGDAVPREEVAPEAPPQPEENSELSDLRAEIEKLQDKLGKSRTDLRQSRREFTLEAKRTEEAMRELVVERDEAQSALDGMQQKLATLKERREAEAESHSSELISIQEKLEEAKRERKLVEAKLARLESERGEAEEQALQSTAELRKQTAFMKKNIATLQGELEAMTAKASGRGRALAILLTVLGLGGGIYMMISPPGCQKKEAPKAPPVAELPRDLAPLGSDMREHEPKPEPDHEAAPVVPAPKTSAAVRPEHGLSSSAAWPKVLVEGVKVIQQGNVCTLRFDNGVFSSMAKLSGAGKRQLLSVANAVCPHMDKFQLIVQGYTDNKPLRNTSTYASNYALGLARAEVVRKLLISDGRLPIAAVRAVSGGENNAPYPNDTAANRKRNRTVVLKLVRK